MILFLVVGGPEDVSLLERCPHFRGWYVQALMELGPEGVTLLERCPHFRGWLQCSLDLKLVVLIFIYTATYTHPCLCKVYILIHIVVVNRQLALRTWPKTTSPTHTFINHKCIHTYTYTYMHTYIIQRNCMYIYMYVLSKCIKLLQARCTMYLVLCTVWWVMYHVLPVLRVYYLY